MEIERVSAERVAGHYGCPNCEPASAEIEDLALKHARAE
jgi:hypothetical protein